MTTRFYLLISIAVFVIVVTGSDLIVRTTIVGEEIDQAVLGHLQWAFYTSIGIVMMFMPFAGVVLICARTNRKARTRSTITIFCIALAILGYFYFNGFQAYQHTMLEKRWTAASLSIGLLPFFIGIPVLICAAIASATVSRFDRRPMS